MLAALLVAALAAANPHPMLGALFVAALAAANPTPTPTSAPTSAPSAPSSCPTVAPTLSLAPTRVPTSRPSPEPTTSLPSPAPTAAPSPAPTMTKAPTRQRRNWAATGLEIGVDYSSDAICADYLAFGRQLNWGGTPGLVLNDNLFSWDGSDLFNTYYVVYEMSGPYYEANYARNENGMSIELTGDARTSKLYDIGAEIMDHFHECSMTLNCIARTWYLPIRQSSSTWSRFWNVGMCGGGVEINSDQYQRGVCWCPTASYAAANSFHSKMIRPCSSAIGGWDDTSGWDPNFVRGNSWGACVSQLATVWDGLSIDVDFGPSSAPTTSAPSVTPSPSPVPTTPPSPAPSSAPTAPPTSSPTISLSPSSAPSSAPSAAPSSPPSPAPSAAPSSAPSAAPSSPPSPAPSARPSSLPSAPPSAAPSPAPSASPSSLPSALPSAPPSPAPSAWPSSLPSALPSAPPSPAPSAVPTGMPLPYPTLAPSPYPTPACDADAHLYRLALSGAGWAAGAAFVLDHRDAAEALVVEGGLDAFGGAYARGATVATGDGAEVFVCLWDGCYDLAVRGNATAPARLDFRDADGHRFACDGVGCAESFCALAGDLYDRPTVAPTVDPTARPTAAPSTAPTAAPSTAPTADPSRAPTAGPSSSPTARPSAAPSATPSASPSASPSAPPTPRPSAAPTTTRAPTATPTTAAPSVPPTAAPSPQPSTAAPSSSGAPSATPTPAPSTASPSAAPTAAPTSAPTARPAPRPTAAPTASRAPSAAPTAPFPPADDGPVDVKLEAPGAVGSCDALAVSAASSTGGGGRPLAYAWAVVATPAGQGCAAAVAAALGDAESASVPPATMAACRGRDLEITATATRFDGAAGAATAAVRVDTAPLPGLAILGGAKQTARPAAGVRVAAVATAAACANSQTPTSNALTFSWSGSLVRDGAAVALPPSASLDGRVYETADVRAGDVFDLAVAVSDGQRRNEAAATVTTAASALVAAIAGGDRTVDGGDAVVLDASASGDPDDAAAALAFRWDCAGADVAGAVASFAASGLAPGAAKTCAVTVSSADAREATATATIARRDGAAAVAAAVVGQPAARVNPSAKLVLAGDAPAGDRAWTLDAGVLAGGASLDAAALTRLDAASLALAAGALAPGASYAFTLRSGAGAATVRITTNAPPFAGTLAASPSAGVALATPFFFAARGWTDDAGDLPLSYGFGLRSATGDAPLRAPGASPSLGGVALPPGNASAYVDVADAYGAATTAYAAVAVRRGAWTAASLATASDAALGVALAARDADRVCQAALAIAGLAGDVAGADAVRGDVLKALVGAAALSEATAAAAGALAAAVAAAATPDLDDDAARDAAVVVGDAAAVASTAGLDAATRTHLVDAVGALLETSAADAAATALDAVGAATLLGAVPGERAVSTCAAQLCVASARDAALATPSVAAAARGDVTLVEYAVDRRGAANLTDAPVARVHVGGGRRRAAAAGGVVRVTFAHPARSPENEALLRNESVDCAARDDVVNGTSCGVDVDCSLFDGFVNPCAAGAACLAYEDAAWGSSGACRAVNATANTTTCACAVDERRSVEVVPSSEIVAREFAAAFRNDPLALGKTRLVLYTLAALAGVLVLATLWGYREDRNDHEKTNEPAETLEPLTPLRTRDRAVQNLNESLPSWARVKSARTFFARLREEHAFLGYVLAYDEVRPRPLRALHLFTDYLWLYAVEAALFIVAFPDMGCDRYVYEAPCLEPTNAYFPAVKACQWRGADVEPSCAPNATEGASIFTYVFLLLVVSSIMVPLSSFVARLVDVLVSPGASSAKVEVGGGGDETLKTVDEEAPMGDRVDFVVRETTVALRARRAELQKAVETGAASPKTLARFEVARGFKPKYTVTWRRLFYRGETDDERFARKTRRSVRRDLQRADRYLAEFEGLNDDEQSKLLGEYARLEQLSPLEQRIYLKNRAEDVLDEHAAEDLPPATRAGRALALVLFIVAVVFPLYYVLVAFQHIAASSKATSREWLKGVSLAVVCDIFLYSPAHVAFFNVYLPSLLRTRLRSLADLRGPSDFEFATPLREGAAAHVAAQKKHLPLAALVLAAQPKPASEATAAAAPRRNAGVAVAVWAAVLLLPELLQDLVVDELIVAGVSALMVLVVEVGRLASRDALQLLDRVGLALWLASLVGGFVAVVAVAAACYRCYARDEAFSVFPDFLFPKSPQQRPSLWAAPEETFTPLHKIGAFFEDDVVGDDRDDDGDATPLVSPRYKADETRGAYKADETRGAYKADETRPPKRLGAAGKLDLLSFDGPLSPEQQQCDALRKTAETELTRLEAHAERQRCTSHDRLERRLHKTERALSPAEARDAEAQHQRTLERVAGRGGESATSTLP